MGDKVEAEGSVQARYVHETTPAYVVTCSVQDDVDSAHITSLPPEELAEVRQQNSHRHKTVDAGFKAMHLIRFHGKAAWKDCPDSAAEPTICKHLKYISSYL